MSEEKQLPSTEVKHTPLGIATFEDITRYAKLFNASGMFDLSKAEKERGEVTSEMRLAQTAVKILAGVEYGLQPFEAMKNLHIVKGKVMPAYQLILRKIRQTEGYDYKLNRWDHDGAEIEIFRLGKSIGVSKFDASDAQRANLAGGNWVNYRRNMMISKAASNAANIICPEIFGGPVYTPEDFDVVVDAEESKEVGEAVRNEKVATTKEKNEAKEKKKDASPKKQPLSDTPVETPSQAEDSASPAAPTGETTTEIPRQEVETTPGEEEWNHIVATGAELGMSEEAVDEVLTKVLEAEGIPTDSQEAVMNNWTHETVKAMLEALVIAANG